jgi:hypothetical protein
MHQAGPLNVVGLGSVLILTPQLLPSGFAMKIICSLLALSLTSLASPHRTGIP